MNKKIIRIILLILIILLCAVIFYFSHQPAEKSSSTSRGFISVILDTIPFTKNLEDVTKLELQSTIHSTVRKLAHFFIYFSLGILLISFINTYNIKIKNKILISSIFGILYAISDEIHQYFIPGRSCEIRDIIIDSAGVLFGIVIFMLIYLKRRKKVSNKMR